MGQVEVGAGLDAGQERGGEGRRGDMARSGRRAEGGVGQGRRGADGLCYRAVMALLGGVEEGVVLKMAYWLVAVL